MSTPVAPLESRFHRVALVLLILLASIERIYGIDRESLWTDELFAVMASYLPSFRDVWPLLINDSHPPAYVSFMYWTLPLTGYTDFGVRLHALLFGIVWIPLVYWLGKRSYSAHVGLLAAALVASSYSGIFYSQEARAYSMLVAINLIQLLCFIEILFSQPASRRHVIGFVLASIAMYYLHYTGFVFIAAEGLLYIIMHLLRIRRGSVRELFVIFGIPLLIYSPWLWFMFDHVADQEKNWAVTAKPTPMDVFYTFRYLWGPDHQQTLLYLYSIPFALAIALYECLRNRGANRAGVTCVVIFLMVVPVLAFYIESVYWTPIFEKRYFLITVPLIALLAAFVVTKAIEYLLPVAWHHMALVMAIILISILMIGKNIERELYTNNSKDPIRQAADIIQADLGDRIGSDEYTVLMTHNSFEHYLKQRGLHYDANWQYRRYYVPQHIGEVDKYLKAHPEIRYFYYIAAGEASADRARIALRIKYRRLARVTLPFDGGRIDVLKYDARLPATPEQLEEARNDDKSPLNDAVKIVANDVRGMDPSTYTILMTHDWVEHRLPLFGLGVDSSFNARHFQNDLQIHDVMEYLAAHPSINTLYYFYLNESHTRSARYILQSRYALQQQWQAHITSGELEILKFDVRKKPAALHDVRQELKDTPLGRAAARMNTHNTPDTVIRLVSHGWMKPWLELFSNPASEAVNRGFLSIPQQATAVREYLDSHPKTRAIDYLALRGTDSEASIAALRQFIGARCQFTVHSPQLGELVITRFDRNQTVNTTAALPACSE